MTRLLIVGAGGHAAVVAEMAELVGAWEQICFVDNKYPDLTSIIDLPVVGNSSAIPGLISDEADFVIAIGNNQTRLKLHHEILDAGGRVVSVVHPSAVVSPSAMIEKGSVVMAQAVINARTTIGAACIINTGATIDHDCRIEPAVHISPGAHLAGGVSVGEQTWIGIGASVVNNVSIGSNSIVGAAAGVLNDVPAGRTVVGTPAREVSTR